MAPELKKILDCLSCLVMQSPYRSNIEDKAFGVVHYNEGLIALHCIMGWFPLEGVDAMASMSQLFVRVFYG